ncbi:hypothetical protein KBI23_07295 [bacterium]|nr:hypothetical protein [bacterium]MBP9809859.1 hypothetical protein [bacterium]
MKASLNPGGLLVTWLPTKNTYDTFRSVFPEHLNFGNTAFGSNQPIILDTAQGLERNKQFCLHDRVKTTGHDGAQLVSQFLSTVLPNDYRAVNPETATAISFHEVRYAATAKKLTLFHKTFTAKAIEFFLSSIEAFEDLDGYFENLLTT